jgi:hypothetical protein
MPATSSTMPRWPRETYAALSSIARKHSIRALAAGLPTSKPRNPGEACTQRLACIRFEKIPTTPFAPGASDSAFCSSSA